MVREIYKDELFLARKAVPPAHSREGLFSNKSLSFIIRNSYDKIKNVLYDFLDFVQMPFAPDPASQY